MGIIVADLATVNFITPIGLGLIVFGVAEYFLDNMYVSVVLVVVVAMVSYYPFFKIVRSESNKKQAAPEDEYVGKTDKVIEVIDEDDARVEVGGEVFYAVTKEPLHVGIR